MVLKLSHTDTNGALPFVERGGHIGTRPPGENTQRLKQQGIGGEDGYLQRIGLGWLAGLRWPSEYAWPSRRNHTNRVETVHLY